MAIQTVTGRRNAGSGYTTPATHCALSSTAPTSTAGTELSGGSPAYARKAITWGVATSGSTEVYTGTVPAIDVASGASVVGVMLYSAVTAGTYLDGATVPTQAFASQGTYTPTLTYTQS